MQPSTTIWCIACAATVTLACHVGVAQDIHLASPVQTVGDSFYEGVGTGFQFDNGSVQFSWQPNVTPAFGGFDPNGAARFGLNAGPLALNLFAGQGSRRSIVSQSPTLTLPNGGTGYFIDAQLRPFVTGFVPVVGGQPTVVYPDLQQRWLEAQSRPETGQLTPPASRRVQRTQQPISSAQQGDISVAEIRRQRAAAANSDEVAQMLSKAHSALAAEKWNLAEHYLRGAMRRATGARRTAIAGQLEQLRTAQQRRPR